jgi:hypothetical protein
MIIFSLSQADTSFNLFKADLIKGAKQSDNLDTSMASGLGDMIHNFKTILPYFYYDDYRDNDNDSWDSNKNGKQDRMIWVDWNFDELIDVDASGTLHIGDAAHRAAHPEYYELVDSTDTDFKRYRYKGPYTYEFIGGDWGVDEEILDGEDNDGDSLVDEDTRITADTLDDDGDWVNTNTAKDPSTAIGDSSYHPMKWVSTNNFTIEILPATGALWDSVVVDSLFTALHNAPNNPMYKFYPIYSFTGYANNFPWPDYIDRYHGADTSTQTEFIGGDYGLDEEWYDGLDNDGDGLFDEDVGERLPPENMRDQLIAELRALGLRGNQ